MRQAPARRAADRRDLDRARAQARGSVLTQSSRPARCTRRCRSSRRPTPNRRNVTHLEAFGPAAGGHRAVDRDGRAPLSAISRCRRSTRAVDPASPDFMNFTRERQPLVDAAFLAQGLLRAPTSLLGAIDARRSGT
jgi:hypothetical protein